MPTRPLLPAIGLALCLGFSPAVAGNEPARKAPDQSQAELNEAVHQELVDLLRRLAEITAMLEDDETRESIQAAMRAVRGPQLGVRGSENEQPPGVRVEQVYPDSPAALADIKAGDVITAVNNRPLDGQAPATRVLQRTLRQHAGTAPLLLALDRNGERLELELTLPD
ncbi:PDZ domain-containing protein [Gammaproteobacteria bacterium AB-CW1]|uniref:PDZ domain-containing protein n=1 Tax=Natronospira elongata TaxID=3110268 RepID=A0AAP6MMJ8_9GAMM|nr:PDZ domain-containing protein [Gammaproteobacteria bacterium AB-CW1]